MSSLLVCRCVCLSYAHYTRHPCSSGGGSFCVGSAVIGIVTTAATTPTINMTININIGSLSLGIISATASFFVPVSSKIFYIISNQITLPLDADLSFLLPPSLLFPPTFKLVKVTISTKVPLISISVYLNIYVYMGVIIISVPTGN